MKKLIPAICMVLVAATLLGTSTFAWFSMNTTVTATGMQITAKTDSIFLQIIPANGSFIDTQAQDSATATNGTKEVRPTSAVKSFEGTSLTHLTSSDKSDAIQFVEAFSNNPASSNRFTNYKDVTTAAKATTGDTNVYTLINEFKIRLNPTTGIRNASNLKVSSVSITSSAAPAQDVMLSAVRVLVVCGEEWALWKNGAKVEASDENSVIAATVTDDTSPNTATDVKVYVFFDGEDSATTTNNAATLSTDGYKVDITFEIGTNS